MPTLETIRRLTIEGRSVGVKEATADLAALGRAQTTVAQTADGLAVATDSSARRQLSAAKSYDSLRMRVDDAYRSQQRFQKDQAIVQRAFDQGSITADEHASTMAMVAQRYGTASVAANENVKQMGLARHEMINLGRQAQDVGTMLAMGASPMQVVTSQAAQVIDIFASSQGSFSGFMKQSASAVGNFLTVGRASFLGVAASIGIASLALGSYLDSQQKVQMSLLGSGRASGQSVSSINGIAQSSASTTGLSVGEARAFAAELASTGKIGRENLEPIVKIGHDIATVYGVDAAEAAKMLGRAYADPVRGAEQLNERLGFLDATMQRQIQNLVAQNRVWEAQRVLHAGVVSGLAGVSEATSTSTKFWTALGNAASNAWDSIGAGLSRVTGIGLKLGLDEQLQVAQERLASFKKDLETAKEYEKSLGGAKGIDTGYDAAIAGVQKYSAEVEKLSGTMKRNADATQAAQDRQRSFAQDAAMRSLMPEVAQLEAIKNQTATLQGAIVDTRREMANLAPDEATGARLKALTDALELFSKALEKSQAASRGFKTESQKLTEGNAIALDAVTAFSPKAKADIASRQARLTYSQDVNVDKLAQDAYTLSLKQSTVALSEAARARKLYADQSVDSAQLEIDLIGKSVGKQAEMRANLQALQTLQQQASQQHTTVDKAELARLEEINRKYGERVELAARAAVNDNIGFGRQTALLAPEDVQIAQQLKGFYPDVATSLASVEAAGLRANTALTGISSTMTSTMTSGLSDILDRTKSLSQGFGDMSRSVARSVLEMGTKMYVVLPIMRMMQAAMGSVGGLFGMPSIAPTNVMVGDYAMPKFDGGGYTGPGARLQPAGIVHAGEYVFSAASVNRIGLDNLEYMHRGYASGGYVTPVSPPAAANGNRAVPVIGNFNVTNNSRSAGIAAEPQVRQNPNGSFDLDVVIDEVAGRLAGRVRKGGSVINDAIEGRYGLNAARGNRG